MDMAANECTSKCTNFNQLRTFYNIFWKSLESSKNLQNSKKIVEYSRKF